MYFGQYFVYDGSSFIILARAVALDAWHYIAVVRSGNMVTMYVGVVAIGSAAVAPARAVGSKKATTYVGGDPDFSQFSSGYLSQIRLTKGNPRYTTSFATATSSF